MTDISTRVINLTMEYKKEKRVCVPPKLGQRVSKWSEQEHLKMFKYLFTHRRELIDHISKNLHSSNRRNKARFFIDMSDFIGTKTESQCKSRFQKKEFAMLEALKVPNSLLSVYMRAKASKQTLKANRSDELFSEVEESKETDNHNVKKLARCSTICEESTLDISSLTPKICNEMFKEQIDMILASDSIENTDDLSQFLNFMSTSQFPAQCNLSFIDSCHTDLMSREGSIFQ